MPLITCRGCSSAISSRAESCPKCGHVVDESKLPSLRCDECGKAIAFEHDGPCPECGNPQPIAEVILRDEYPRLRKRPGSTPEKAHEAQATALSRDGSARDQDLAPIDNTKVEVTESAVDLKKVKDELRRIIVLNGFEVHYEVRRCTSCNNLGEVGSKKTLFGRISDILEGMLMLAGVIFVVSLAGCFFSGAGDSFLRLGMVTFIFAALVSMAKGSVDFITPTENYFCPKCGHRGFRFKKDL
jgi:hypothetical protein